MEFLRKYKEVLLGITMLLIGVVLIFATTQIQLRVDTRIDARFVPYILGAACILLGVLQCTGSLAMLKKGDPSKTEAKEPSDPKSVILTFLLIVVYVSTLRYIGFLINNIWMMFLMMMLLSPKEKWRYGQFALISVLSTVIIYYLFRNGLDLMLPDGLLG